MKYKELWTPCVAALALCAAGCSEAANPPPRPPSAAALDEIVRVLVVHGSVTGHSGRMAKAVAEGAQRVEGVVAVVKPAEEVAKADLESADALILGSPTHYANLPGGMKTVLDGWVGEWRVDLTDKVGGAFATAGGRTGGKEHVVVSLLLYMLENRMVVAGPLFEAESFSYGEIGASAITGESDPGVDEGELDGARRLGERIAELARRMQAEAQ